MKTLGNWAGRVLFLDGYTGPGQLVAPCAGRGHG